jgi:hypothetical protein
MVYSVTFHIQYYQSDVIFLENICTYYVNLMRSEEGKGMEVASRTRYNATSSNICKIRDLIYKSASFTHISSLLKLTEVYEEIHYVLSTLKTSRLILVY